MSEPQKAHAWNQVSKPKMIKDTWLYTHPEDYSNFNDQRHLKYEAINQGKKQLQTINKQLQRNNILEDGKTINNQQR